MSNHHSILGSLALGYTPMVDKQRLIEASRLTVFPLRPDAKLDAAELLAAVQDVWPAGGAPVVLNILNEGLLKDLLASPLPKNISLELPSFMAGDASLADCLAARAAEGLGLILKGRPHGAMPPGFKQVVLDLDEERANAAGTHQLPAGGRLLFTGVHSAADFDECFRRGAQSVLGWPIHGEFVAPATPSAKTEIQADLQVIVELMSRVDQGEDIVRLEQTLKRDPSLAFKLLRYLNSAAFGLPVEVTSFRHAIMLLGYPRLKRWLALLLTTASKDHNMRPVMHAALRRGLLLEDLAKGMSDAELRDEMFICGLFSLLDHMLKQPFDKLLQSIPMPERVRQALVDKTGPYQPYLELIHAIESESVFDYRSAAEKLMLGAEEINHALLRALSKAAQLE